jgi:predicted ATP-dependent endonuclease of OLD family
VSKIVNIEFDNLLSFKSTTKISDLSDVSVFVGPNNSGKTNIFKCLEIYHDLILDANYKGSKYMYLQSKYHQKNANKKSSIKVEYVIQSPFNNIDATITHTLGYGENGGFQEEQLIMYQRIDKIDKTLLLISKFGNHCYKITNEIFVKLLKSANNEDNRTDNVNNDLQTYSPNYYGPFVWDENVDKPAEIDELFRSIKTFVSSWYFINSDRRITPDKELQFSNALKKQWRATSRKLENICNFLDVSDINYQNKDGEEFSNFTDQDNIISSLNELGSGYGQIYYIFNHIDNDVSVCFIDEPELHLHAKLQRKLFNSIISNSDKRQFLLNTHSSIFCQPKNGKTALFLVQKMNAYTKIERISGESLLEVKSILGHTNIDLFVYNAVIVIEGETELGALPVMARNLGIDLTDNGVALLDARGFKNISALASALILLKKSSIRTYVLCDNHVTEKNEFGEIKMIVEEGDIRVLSKGFEDEFNSNIIIEAVNQLLNEKDQGLDEENKKSLQENLENDSQKTTFNKITDFIKEIKKPVEISKIKLGIKIAEILNEKEMIGNSQPEELLMKVKKDIEKLDKLDEK